MFARSVSHFRKRHASSSATCIRCATSRFLNSREATRNPDRAVERWCAALRILLSRSAELDVRRKMCISSSRRFGMSTLSLTSQSAFGIFLKSLISPASRSVHEILLGWAEQAFDATNTIPADDDLGIAVMVTDRHDWNWDRLRVRDGLISSSFRHSRGKQSGAVWERVARSRRTSDHRTWEIFLSSQSAMQALLPGLDVPWNVGRD